MPEQGASTTTRSKDPSGQLLRPPPNVTVAAHDLDGVELARRALDEAGAVRVYLVGGHARSHASGKAGQERGLASGTRTQVEPALVGAALERCRCGNECGEL